MGAISKIIIVGDGDEALLASIILAKHLPDVAIHLFQSKSAHVAPVAKILPTSYPSLLALLGIKEEEFFLNTQACFRLANHFIDWNKTSSNFYQGLGDYGARLIGAEFGQVAIKLHRHNVAFSFDEFSVSAVAAKSGKLSMPDDYAANHLPAMKVGLHFDFYIFMRFLAGYSRQQGVTVTYYDDLQVTLADDGGIGQLTINHKEMHDADLYVDCTGKSGVLIESALNIGFEAYDNIIPVDRVIYSVSALSSSANLATTKLRRVKNGFIREIPLRNKASIEFYYSSKNMSHEDALNSLMSALGVIGLDCTASESIKVGRRLTPWYKNCLALGKVEGNLGVHFYSDIATIMASIVRFLELYPGNEFEPSLINEYNRLAKNEFERARDYEALHYHLSAQVSDEPAIGVPNELAYKLRVFDASGRIPMLEDELVDAHQWLSLLLGLGVWPKRCDPTLENISSELMGAAFFKLREEIEGLVASMPSYSAYLSYVLSNYKKEHPSNVR